MRCDQVAGTVRPRTAYAEPTKGSPCLSTIMAYKNKFKHYRKTEFVLHRFQWSALLDQVASEEAEKIRRDLTPSMLVLLVCTLPARRP